MSSRDRKKGITLKKEKEKKTSKKRTNKNTEKRKRNEKEKKGIGKKILTIFLGLAIFFVLLIAIFMIYIVISTGNFEQGALGL